MLYIIISIILLSIIISCIQIVPEARAYVVEFLGSYQTTWNNGLHLKIPFLQRISKKVSLKEQVYDFDPQSVITKDNVTMKIDTVVYFKIFNPKLFTYGVDDPIFALENLTATTLRNIVGDLELDDTLTSRDTINTQMRQILDEATDAWGIKVTRVELKNIIPPREIQDAMEKQMKAERDRRETLLEAEGHKAAVVTRAEGEKQAKVLAAEAERDAAIALAKGEAEAKRLVAEAEAAAVRLVKEAGADETVLALRRIEALAKMADGRATKLFVPSDMMHEVGKTMVMGDAFEYGRSEPKPVPPSPAPKKKADPCCD